METWSIWLDPNNMFPALFISFSASVSHFIRQEPHASHCVPLPLWLPEDDGFDNDARDDWNTALFRHRVEMPPAFEDPSFRLFFGRARGAFLQWRRRLRWKLWQLAGYIIAMKKKRKKRVEQLYPHLPHTHPLTRWPSITQQPNWKISRDTSDFRLLGGFFFFIHVYIYTGSQIKKETNPAVDHRPLLMDTQDTRHSWTGKPSQVTLVSASKF